MKIIEDIAQIERYWNQNPTIQKAGKFTGLFVDFFLLFILIYIFALLFFGR